MVSESAHRCRRCYGPLVEVLSDRGGRLFGCLNCRTISAANALRPAMVTASGERTPRERRRMARRFTRGRRGARRVPERWEVTRSRPDRWAVIQAKDLSAFCGGEAQDLGSGWVLCAITLDRGGPVLVRDMPQMPDRISDLADRPAFATTRAVDIKEIGGLTFGCADASAPQDLVLRAFARLSAARVHEAAHHFNAEWIGSTTTTPASSSPTVTG